MPTNASLAGSYYRARRYGSRVLVPVCRPAKLNSFPQAGERRLPVDVVGVAASHHVSTIDNRNREPSAGAGCHYRPSLRQWPRPGSATALRRCGPRRVASANWPRQALSLSGQNLGADDHLLLIEVHDKIPTVHAKPLRSNPVGTVPLRGKPLRTGRAKACNDLITCESNQHQGIRVVIHLFEPGICTALT